MSSSGAPAGTATSGLACYDFDTARAEADPAATERPPLLQSIPRWEPGHAMVNRLLQASTHAERAANLAVLGVDTFDEATILEAVTEVTHASTRISQATHEVAPLRQLGFDGG